MYGIYAITINTIPVYVGYTTKDFQDAFNRINRDIKDGKHTKLINYLRRCKELNKEVKLVPLESYDYAIDTVSEEALKYMKYKYRKRFQRTLVQ